MTPGDDPAAAGTASRLHLVFGGRVRDPQTLDFVDPASLEIVGIFPDYPSAENAWRGAAQRTVAPAPMKFGGVHLTRQQAPGGTEHDAD